MITVYGDSISGNCLKVKWVCERLAIAHRWVETSVVQRQTRTETFLRVNPAGQVPAIVLEDGRLLSQSAAIMLHLAEGSDLIPDDRYQRAVMFQWLFWEQYSHEPNIATRRFHKTYLGKADDAMDPSWLPAGIQALTRMDDHLGAQDYFAGNRLSLADIALVAYTRVAHEGGFDLSAHPNVVRWIARVERDLGLGPAS